jgi:fructokinase
MDIVTLGELLIDMFPAELGKSLAEVSAFRPKPGGAPANVAIAARRLGAQTAFIGKVGDDAFGYHLRDVLRVEGVDTRGLRFDALVRTTMALIAMPDENTAEFVFYRNPGADTRLRADELDEDLLRSARAFHFGSLSLTDEPARSATQAAVQIAERGGALISFDVNYRPRLWSDPDEAATRIRAMLPFVNLVKVNEVELPLLTGTDDLDRGSAALLEIGPSLCLVTLGPRGSYFQSEQGGGRVPAFAVNTVDATGCGDAFIAGVLTRLVAAGANWRDRLGPGWLRDTLRYANAVGALTAQTQGVIPALPRAHQVNEFLLSQIT